MEFGKSSYEFGMLVNSYSAFKSKRNTVIHFVTNICYTAGITLIAHRSCLYDKLPHFSFVFSVERTTYDMASLVGSHVFLILSRCFLTISTLGVVGRPALPPWSHS